MRSIVRVATTVLALTCAAALHAPPASAQGITTASVRGRVLDQSGEPIQGAVITLTNTSTGQRYQGISRADGLYNIENAAVGGPYTAEARLIGYQSMQRTGIVLSLSQIVELNLTMGRAAVQIEALTVTAQELDPLTAPSRTGTGGFVSDSAVRRLPTLNRNFTDFIATVPQVASIQDDAPSLGGGHNRMNNIQIDGVSDNDLFGLGSTGQPGGQVDAKSITLEAVKEFQVLIAPFDIRQSGFSGGLINAVTKRGTNQWSGSAFWYYQRDGLVRDSLPANSVRFGDYRQDQRGLSFGGPIVRDRVHFFAAAEWQARETPNLGSTIGREAPTDVQVSADSAQRLVDILQGTYGVDAGSFRASTIGSPNKNFFGRLDVQLADNHVLTLRHNNVTASSDLGIFNTAGSYEFTSNAYTINSNTNSSVLQVNSTLGGGKFFNEFRLGYLRIRDRRDPNVPFAALEVDNRSDIGGTIFNNTFNVGAERFSQRNRLNQDVFEITNDLTFARGRHTVTAGTHNEMIAFDNTFFHTSIGRWRFNSLADLANGTPREYFVQIPFAGVTDQTTAGRADWSLWQLGFYLQDQWQATPNLRITAGVRVDVPILNDTPKANPPLEQSAALGAALQARGLGPIRTDVIPSGNLHWSPRLGFNWAVDDDRMTVVRGGAGLFTGRPAYVWLSNAYTNTGRDIVTVTCRSSTGNVPPFNSTTIITPPQDCVGVSGITVPRSQVNYFEEDFKFPQQLKASLAVDRRLVAGIIGTVEFLYTKGINTIYQQEMNIAAAPLRTNAEGRQMFGSGFSGGNITPTRVDPNFAHILRHTNRSDDRAIALTAQLQKRFDEGFEFNAAYTYQNVKDVTSLGSSIASSNFGFSPVSAGENPNQKSLTRSRFDIPHRLVLSGTVNIPIPSVPTSLTMIYVGQSGAPFTWTTRGDVNGDGYEAPEIGSRRNDIVYVPTATGLDFTPENIDPLAGDLARYNALIALQPCLEDARGSIPERNTCRNPWTNRLDASFRIGVGRAVGGMMHHLTLVGDIFNLPNLLNSDWGVVRGISFFETRDVIELRGYDAINDRGIYRYRGPSILGETPEDAKRNLESVSDLSSRWRMQLGLRWDF